MRSFYDGSLGGSVLQFSIIVDGVLSLEAGHLDSALIASGSLASQVDLVKSL